MISIRDYQQLQDKLLNEQNARLEKERDHKKLSSELEILRLDFNRKEYELKAAKGVVLFMKKKQQVQELIEQNLALTSQVESLKQMLTSTTSSSSSSSTRDQHQGSQDASLDMQSVLEKLNSKEEEIVAMKNECQIWEKQVMDLKFELQSIRFAAQEQAAEYNSRQQAGVSEQMKLQERLTETVSNHKTLEKRFFTSSLSQQNLEAEINHFKKLALERALYWRQTQSSLEECQLKYTDSQDEIKKLSKKIMELLEENSQFSEQLDHNLREKNKLKEQLSEAQKQAEKAQETLLMTTLEMDRLQKDAAEIPVLQKVEKVRCTKAISELQKEIRSQKLRIEQLESASNMYSPRNSRGIDVCRQKGEIYSICSKSVNKDSTRSVSSEKHEKARGTSIKMGNGVNNSLFKNSSKPSSSNNSVNNNSLWSRLTN